MKFLGMALLVLLFASPAFAYEKIFDAQCKAAGVPKKLAMAIARQESGLNPLCINVEGEDFWPKNRAEAEAIIRRAQKEGRSFDVGLMQINSQWIRQWKIDPASLLDPETNIRHGLKILKDEIKRHGPGWRAVGAYHSPDPVRARLYASKVLGHMRGGRAFPGMAANPRLYGAMAFKRRFKHFRLSPERVAAFKRELSRIRKTLALEGLPLASRR